jgi:oligopeptidase B
LIEGSERHYIRGLTAFTNVLAITERDEGLDQIRLRFPDGRETRIPFPEASYTVSLGDNREADPRTLRLGYTSMVTPATVYDYDLAAASLTTRKVQQIPSGYDASQYTTERLMIPARDGTPIPVSIVYKNGWGQDGGGDGGGDGTGSVWLPSKRGRSVPLIVLTMSPPRERKSMELNLSTEPQYTLRPVSASKPR